MADVTCCKKLQWAEKMRTYEDELVQELEAVLNKLASAGYLSTAILTKEGRHLEVNGCSLKSMECQPRQQQQFCH